MNKLCLLFFRLTNLLSNNSNWLFTVWGISKRHPLHSGATTKTSHTHFLPQWFGKLFLIFELVCPWNKTLHSSAKEKVDPSWLVFWMMNNAVMRRKCNSCQNWLHANSQNYFYYFLNMIFLKCLYRKCIIWHYNEILNCLISCWEI